MNARDGPALSAVEGRRIPWLLAAAAYVALTVATMWPVVAHVASALPHDAIDPVLNTWIISWNAQALPLTSRWRDAPIFWPMPGSLMLSEHLIGIAVVTTPLQWAGLTPVAAYNLAWLVSFPLSALAAHALAFAIVKRHDAAAISGLVFGFSPFRIAQAAHLQMLWAFWIPLALLALHRYVERRERIWLALFGMSWLMQALTSGYYLLFVPIVLGCWIIWFTVGRSPSAPLAIVSVWLVASLPLVPFLRAYLLTHDALNLQRSIGEIESFSADAIGIVLASPDLMFWHRLSRPIPEGLMFPGALALTLFIGAAGVAARSSRVAPRDRERDVRERIHLVLVWLTTIVTVVGLSPLVIGGWEIAFTDRVLLSVHSIEKPMSIALMLSITLALTSRPVARWWRDRSPLAFYVLAAGLTYLLSLGPHVRFAGTPVVFHAPYFWLLQLPGFSAARAPGRIGMLFVLCVAVTAAIVFARATQGMGSRARRGLAAAGCLVIAVESWPSMAVAAAPLPIRALAAADPLAPVLELPAGDPERDVAAVYRSIAHGRPVVNGYSGYVPPHYRVLLEGFRLDDAAALTALTGQTPLTVVIDRRQQIDRWAALIEKCHGSLVDDDGSWRVYSVPGGEGDRTYAAGAPLPIASVVANTGKDAVNLMVDGNPATAWSSQRVQAGDEEITIDLGADRTVEAVRLALGMFVDEFPRSLDVECAAAAAQWQPCWKGSVPALALGAVLADARVGAMMIPIGLDHIRRLRLRQTGADPVNRWSISELAVLGR